MDLQKKKEDELRSDEEVTMEVIKEIAETIDDIAEDDGNECQC